MEEIKERLKLTRMSPWILFLGCVWTCMIIIVQIIFIKRFIEGDLKNLVFLGLSILFFGFFIYHLIIIFSNLRKLDKFNDMLDKLILNYDNEEDIIGSLQKIIDKVTYEVEDTPFGKFNFQLSKRSNQSTLHLHRQMINMKEELEDICQSFLKVMKE